MKTNKLFTSLIFIVITLLSCNKDDSSDEVSNGANDRSGYHVVASIDGTEIEFAGILGDYVPIYSFLNGESIYKEVYSQNEEFPYVLTMSFFEEDISLGSHQLSSNTSLSSDALFLNFDEATFFQYISDSVLKTGSITFTEIDRENDVLAGTFELEAEITSYKDQDNPEIYDISVTNGSFRIKFPEE